MLDQFDGGANTMFIDRGERGGGGSGGGGGAGGGGGMSGGNQWMNFPTMPSVQTRPGVVPPATGGPRPTTMFGGGGGAPTGTGRLQPIGQGFHAVSSMSPRFTQDFYSWLSQQMGTGATPFNLQSSLPSSGGATQAGDLSAPLNDILSRLRDFYAGKGSSGMPGLDTMKSMSDTGMPVDAMPAWQAMVEAMKRNIDRGAADLREQFAFSGNLASSPFGNAAVDYYTQAGKDQNALLGQMSLSAMESARGRQASASESLMGQGGQLGEFLQGLDQDSIDRLLAEFVRTRPEYGPLINAMFGAATTFPPVVNQSFGLGAGGALLGSAGSIASGVADIIAAMRNRNSGGSGPTMRPSGGGPGTSSMPGTTPPWNPRPGGGSF